MNLSQSSLSEIGERITPARNKQQSSGIMKQARPLDLLPTIEAQGLTSLPKNTTLGMISVNAQKTTNKVAGMTKNVQLLCVRTKSMRLFTALTNRIKKDRYFLQVA
jgi:hypothetical protein